jgi:LCP family protein required for cell wall assembly
MREERRYRLLRSIKNIIICLILLLPLCAIGAVYLFAETITEDKVEIVKEEEITEEDLQSENVPIIEEEPIQEDVINVLLVGSDSKNPKSDSGRSDTMMLLSWNKTTNKASMISFLRDSLVEVPGHGMTRLGHSYAYGGVGLTINTINQTYGLDIQNYIVINFENLVHVIDAIGGIEMTLTKEEVDYLKRYKFDFQVGNNLLNGKQALQHARNRKVGSDFARTSRQRDVIHATYNKIMENKNPAEILALIQFCMTQVRTNMSIEDIYFSVTEVMEQAPTIAKSGIPASGTYVGDRYKNMSILRIDVEANKKIIREMLYSGGGDL